MNYLTLFAILLSSSIALAASEVASPKKCEEALFASGDQWMRTHFSPLPKFIRRSPKRLNIYFYIDDPCLKIFIQQGPYGGWSYGANKIEKFYLSYDQGVLRHGLSIVRSLDQRR